MPKKSRWPWRARKSNESPAANTSNVPQALPDPAALTNSASVPLPQRPISRSDDTSSSRLSSPASALGASPNTLKTEAQNDGKKIMPQPIQHSISQDQGSSGVHAEKKGYWQLAVDELQKEDPSIRGQIAAVQQAAAEAGNADFAAQLLQTTQQGQKGLESKRWKISAGSREVVLRDHFDRLVKAMAFLKDVSNAVGSIDPVHAGLPLAGFCFLMQMAFNDSEQYAAIMTGVEEIVTIVARYIFIEAHYQSRANSDLKQEFERRVVALYKQTIRYQISATRYYQRNTMHRFLRALPKLDDLSEVMAAIRRHDGACRDISQDFDRTDASERHQELVEKLERPGKYLIHDKDTGTPSNPIHTHWIVTRSINTLFTGRDELLTELETIARDAIKDPSRNDQCRVVITGVGGQGKSEICVQLAHRIRQAFWGVFWVDVSTTSSAESAFLHIAGKLGTPAQNYGEVVQDLASTQHPWLLVLDNADDPRVDYQRYLPTGPWGVVILTSRNEECHTHATAKSINLDGLSDAEACELLMRAAKIPHDQHQTLEHDAREVAALLRSHPLALIQAASYIAGGHSTMADYPRVFAQKRQQLLAFHPTQGQSRYRDVYATFEASAEILQSTGTEAATDALELLPVLATFDSNRLPLPLFEAGWKGARALMAFWNSARDDAEYADDADTLKLTKWHTSRLLPLMQVDAIEWDSFRLFQAIDILKSFALVSTDPSSGFFSVSMHPLVHAWARDRQKLAEQNTSWITSGCITAISQGVGDFWLQHGRQLRPHLHALVAFETSRLLVCNPLKKITSILVVCGWLLYDMMDSAEVCSLTQGLFMSLDLDVRVVEEEWLEIYDLTARNLRRHGQPNEAVVLLKQIISFQEQRLSQDDTKLLKSQHELAISYQENGQVQEAIPLLERVVENREKSSREDDPNMLASQYALASAYNKNRQVQEAITLLEQVVKIEGRILREDHPDRLTSQHELANSYKAIGQVQEAINLLEQVVKISGRIQREDHPNRLTSQHDLASSYLANRQVQEAIILLEQVVNITEETLREDHPSRLSSLHNLAICYWTIGCRDTAFEMMSHVVKLRQQVIREEHPERLNSQHILAMFCWALGRRNAAYDMMAHVVKIEQQVLPAHHPDRTASEEWLEMFSRKLHGTEAE